MKYLLDPKVQTAECKMLTSNQFGRLLKKLNSKKFAAKIVAVDAEEIVTKSQTILSEGRGYVKVTLPAGNYFNVHVEFVL